VTAFYDIDTPVTLAKLVRDKADYVSSDLVAEYDLYLSFTGGPTLTRLEREYGSPAARQLYCSADPEEYCPRDLPCRWDLTYLGTYSADRQPLLEPARRLPDRRFAVAGPLYPSDIPWPRNVERIEHVPPSEHAVFYASSRFTLNVTRADMARAGYSPSVRLFEAGACGVPIISDRWAGIETIFQPGAEIVLADTSDAVGAALETIEPAQRDAMARRVRARVLQEHTAAHRAEELEGHLHDAAVKRRMHRGIATARV
jgi:spore maturation protein CgeB